MREQGVCPLRPNVCLWSRRTYTTQAPFVRFCRKAAKHVRTLIDRLWLQAAVQRIVIYVGLTPSSGSPIWIRARIHQVV